MLHVMARTSGSACRNRGRTVAADSRRGQSTPKGRRDADRNLQRRPLNHATIQQSRCDQSRFLSADRCERVKRNRLFRNFAFGPKARKDPAKPAKNGNRFRQSAPPGLPHQR